MRCAARFAVAGAVAVVLTATGAMAPAAASLNGYLKNFFIVQRIPQYRALPGATEPPPGGATLVADNLRARFHAYGDPTSWLTLAASYDFVPRLQDDDNAALNEFLAGSFQTTYRVADLEPFLYPRDPGNDDNFVVLQNLDRLSASFAAPAFDFIVGRQAVAWGSARGVNPTDVIAPFLFTQIDTEDRVGVDAARLRAPLGALGEVDVGYVGGDEFADSLSAYYARVKYYMLQTDVAALLIRFRRHLLAGVDVQRAIGGAGFWFEGAWVRNDDDSRASSPVAGTRFDDAEYVRVSTGLDYSLGGGTYLFAEYHFNGAGAGDPGDYRFLAGKPAYTDGSVYLFGRHYLIPGVTWPATALWNVTGTVLWNVSDGSPLFSATVEYNWTENTYVSAGAFVGVGPAPTYDPVPGSPPVVGSGLILDPFSTQFGSEFGAYPDTYYASIRYYF